MKLTEGLLQHTFEEFAPQYPSVESKHILIDNCAHQLAMRPEQFDVIVTTNMNGDILSDLTSGLTGGLGFAPSANIGNDVSIFEAVHGSAPDIAGKNKANPTALILSAAMMLRHIGEGKAANDVEQAVLVTLESGMRTSDMIGVRNPASTTDFTKAVISNLGKRSKVSPPRDYKKVELPPAQLGVNVVPAKSRRVMGVDVYVESELEPKALAASLEALAKSSPLRLEMITNRGAMVYPVQRSARVTRRPLSLPVRAARLRIRSRRRRHSRLAGHHRRSVPLDAHREAPGVRRKAGLQQIAGLEV